MKNAFALFFAFAAMPMLFAGASATQSFDGELYHVVTASDLTQFHVKPYLYFENTLHAEYTGPYRVIYGNPGDLRSGDIICEGNVAMNSDVSGRWAHGGFYAASEYWHSCEPPAYSRVSNNRPVTWSVTGYNALFPEEVCYPLESSCWNARADFVTQKIDMFGVTPSEIYYNREGQVAVVCKGVSTLRSGTALINSSVISDGGRTGGSAALTRGSVVLSSTMDVQGCLVVVRHPSCPGDEDVEKIFGRTRAEGGYGAPGYSTSIPATMNIRVVSNADLRCSAEIFSVTPSPMNISPGGSEHVTIRVRNSCPASDPLCRPINVSSLRVTTEGFRYTPDLVLALPGPLGGSTASSRRTAAGPGETITFSGTVVAPNDPGVCEDLHGTITFEAQYDCTDLCGPGGPGMAGRTVQITVPYECPPPGLNLTRDVNLVPRFDPDPGSTITISTGERPNISIITWNRGMNFSNPGETCIVICAPGDDSCADPVAEYRYSYPALGPLGEFGEQLGFTCSEEDEGSTFNLFVGVDCTDTTNETSETDNSDRRRIFCAPPANETTEERYGCDIIGGPYVGRAGQQFDFEVRCRNNELGMPWPCGEVGWSYHIDGSNITVSEEDDGSGDYYWVVLGPGTRGEGTVRVTAEVEFTDPDGNATCSSSIHVPLVPCVDFV